MGRFTDLGVDFKKQQEQALEEEAQVHESYCLELLQKHMLEPERHKADVVSGYRPLDYLDKLGYFVEHRVEPDKDGKAEIRVWRLFKLVDSSSRYRIKRVMSVEEKPTHTKLPQSGSKGDKV